MLFVDSHVHLYSCFDLEALFNAALRNFQTQALRLNRTDEFTGVLLLTERQGDHWFDILVECASENGGACPEAGHWRISLTRECESLVLTRGEAEKIVLIAGRQMVSREGLEVLGLMTTAGFDEGLPAADLVEEIRHTGGVPVIPWAFGKWFGARGKVLRQMVDHRDESAFFLGDNGGRPAFLRLPEILRQEKVQGRKVISGTDPLPLNGEECRVGSFGIYVDAELDFLAPAVKLRSLMADTADTAQFKSYGEPISFSRFVRNQWMLRRG